MSEIRPSPSDPDFGEADGLIPVVVQDYRTGEVLMLAWMNRQAWDLTLERKRAVYWSRSRSRLWEKGEISGNGQVIEEIYLDCDKDCILLKVNQRGNAACHTGRRSCFFHKVDKEKLKITSEPLFNPTDIYGADS